MLGQRSYPAMWGIRQGSSFIQNTRATLGGPSESPVVWTPGLPTGRPEVFTGVALLIFLKNFSFAFTTWLFDASTIKAYLSFGHAFLRKLNHVSLLV